MFMSEAKVYCVSNINEITENEIRFISSVIPKYRLQKSQKYLKTSDRNACIVTFFLLLYGLKKNYNINYIPDILFNQYQKPYFKDNNICFNISHSDTAVCCGISENGIGTDVQSIVCKYDDIIDMVMSPEEKKIIGISSVPRNLFTKFWTLKECFVKYHGIGLNNDINKIVFSPVCGEVFYYNSLWFRSELYDNFYLSACSALEAPCFIYNNIGNYIDEFKKM